MKIEFLIIAVAAILGFAAIFVTLNKTQQTPQFLTASSFTFTDTTGQTHTLTDFKDRIVILNFWASWCAPCIKEFPLLIKAAQNYPDNVTLIALSSDIEESTMNKFIAKYKIPTAHNIHIAFDTNQRITNTYNVTKLPKTFIINQHQEITHHISGADWDYDSLENRIKMLLGSIKKGS